MSLAELAALKKLAYAAKSAIQGCEQRKGEVFLPAEYFRTLREAVRHWEQIRLVRRKDEQ